MRLNIFNARSFVPPEGIAASASCAIVGDSPTYHEAKAGRMFEGASGRVLQNCMASANLIRGECYLTYVIKDIDKPVQRRFNSKSFTFDLDGQEYIKLLKNELNNCSAKFIIAVGEMALNALTSRSHINKWRGSVIESTLVPGKWVIPIIHPNTVPPPKNIYLNKYLISFDLQRAAKWIDLGEYVRPNTEVVINPSYNEILNYLTKLKTCKLIAFDIEVFNEEVSCISFSHNDRYAMSIPFVNSKGDMWTVDQELEIWTRIAELLCNNSMKLGQNLSFDAHFLLRKYGIVVNNIHDTMVAQQIISPDFKKGLDFIASVHTELPYHKDEGKKWFKVGGSWEQLWNYNGLDSLVCSIAFSKQMSDVNHQDNLATYNRQRAIIEPLVYIQEHGIRADMEGMKSAKTDMDIEVETLRAKLSLMAGRELNANSPKQLKEYFYKTLRYPAYRKKGSVTTDDLAMKRLIRKGCKEAKIVLKIRKLRKLSSTYLDPAKFDSDDRIRCSYNPVGTRYSRVSSSKNIFGTGMNMQNWPHKLLYYLMVDPNCVGYALDLSQAENRIVAQVGRVTKMIQAFNDGKDVHSMTGGLIFDEDPDQIKWEANRKIKCKTLGDGSHTKRDWGKKANHGLNYDLGFRNFALRYEIPERQAKFIIERYHSAYPGVRQVFHKLVRTSLHTNRMITNLMGRKTLFLGHLDDQTFKEAYSCIPQGTVGDVINERAMSYLYYNQDLFGPVELLGQVHDEIVFQIPSPMHPTRPCSWERHAQILMLIKQSMETPLTANGNDFVIPVDTTIFQRFKNGIDISSNEVSTDVNHVSGLIEETFNRVSWNTSFKEYNPQVPR